MFRVGRLSQCSEFRLFIIPSLLFSPHLFSLSLHFRLNFQDSSVTPTPRLDSNPATPTSPKNTFAPSDKTMVPTPPSSLPFHAANGDALAQNQSQLIRKQSSRSTTTGIHRNYFYGCRFAYLCMGGLTGNVSALLCVYA